MRLRLLQLKNWRKRQRIKQHPAVYLQRHFVILMHLIFIFLQTTEQKAPHIGLGCSLHRQWGFGETSTNGTQKVTLPISASALIGVVSDRGVSPIYYSFNEATLTVYGRSSSGSFTNGAFGYIVICH